MKYQYLLKNYFNYGVEVCECMQDWYKLILLQLPVASLDCGYTNTSEGPFWILASSLGLNWTKNIYYINFTLKYK